MLSLPHQWGVDDLRQRPDVLLSLLPRNLTDSLPRGVRIEVGDPSAVPPYLPDWRCDGVVIYRHPETDEALLVVCVEIQLSIAAVKRRRWVSYPAVLHDRHDCLIALVVVCVDEAVARWAARPIEWLVGSGPVCPHVLGPGEFPRVTDLGLGLDFKFLPALSLAAHPADDQVREIVVAVAQQIWKEDRHEMTVYTDFALSLLDGPARERLGARLMATIADYEWRTEEARTGYANGREAGLIEGLVEGEARGEARGKAEGKAEAILLVLDGRGIAVPARQRRRILACADVTKLDRWLTRAVFAKTIGEVFLTAPGSK